MTGHCFLSARRTQLHDINTVPLPYETPRTRKLFNRLPSRTIYANNTDVPCSESPCNYAPDDVTGYFTGLLFLKFFLGDISFLRGHWYPWFGILVTSTLDFKARLDPSLACFRACAQCIPQIHLWCDTWWPLGSQHGCRAFWSTYVHMYKHWWDSNLRLSVRHNWVFPTLNLKLD